MPTITRKPPSPSNTSWESNLIWLNSSIVDKSILNVWNKITGFELSTSWLVINEAKIIDYIQSRYSNANTRRNHFRVYLRLIKDAGSVAQKSRVTKIWKQETEASYKAAGENVFSDSRKINFVSEIDIISKMDDKCGEWLKDLYNSKLNIQCLMLSLYTLRPPLRGEWFNMLIWDKPESPPRSSGKMLIKDNYLFRRKVTDPWKILINNDKQVSIEYNKTKEYRSVVFDLDDKLWQQLSGKRIFLNDVINKSLQYYPRSYVLSSITVPGGPLAEGFRRQMSYIFGKNVGVDVLRQAYVNHMLHSHDLSQNDRIKVAKNMRHSVVTADTHYKKLKSEMD